MYSDRFSLQALDKVAESRINSLPADAPDALIDDAAVIDHSSGDDQEDSIIDDGSRIQGSHTALSMELDGGVVNNSGMDSIQTGVLLGNTTLQTSNFLEYYSRI